MRKGKIEKYYNLPILVLSYDFLFYLQPWLLAVLSFVFYSFLCLSCLYHPF